MSDELEILKKRIVELGKRSYSRSQYVSSDFLTLAEQSEVQALRLDAPYTLCGGYESAERRLVFFGNEDLCGYEAEPPIVCVGIFPVQQKFADDLSHRDFLGSLMGLGIKRETLGDIIISDNCGYLFCLDTIADYIIQNLIQVRRTTVHCEITTPPEKCAELPEQTGVNVASERLDALVAAVFKLSRGDSQELFSKERVFANGKLITSASYSPHEGDIISVRSLGRFRYDGVDRETKRGRLRVLVRIF